MVVLAHNAAMTGVPYDFDRLMSEPSGGVFLAAFRQVVQMAMTTRDKAASSQ